MSEIRTFFRFCPACGRRFHIKLTGKKQVDERVEETEFRRATMTSAAASGYGRNYVSPNRIIVEENVPVTVDVKDFEYTYQCKHCGHVWSEMRTKESDLSDSDLPKDV